MKKSDIKKLTLDTHVIIWYLEGINLSPHQISVIEEARNSDTLFLSSISIWEIAMLSTKGKLNFSITMNDFLDKLTSVVGVKLIDLTPEILIESCNLINYAHKDPADRMIVASCRKIDSHLMTFDQKIIDYGKQGYIKLASPGL